MEKITVLTAVYNAAPYLRQCLDSLKSQTLADCQFICIDDCSTDDSMQILRKYASEDKRFQILRTPANSGQARARNLGLQFARGEYIAMLDADDWFAPDTLQQAYTALRSSNAQCAVLQLVQHYEPDGREEIYAIKSEKTEWSGEEAFLLSLDWSLHGLYVVTAELHKRFPFDDSSRLYSDDNTTRLHYLNADKVVLCPGRYFYRKHPSSMTMACSVRRFDHMLANLSMKRQIEKLSLERKEEILNLYERYRWLNIIGCYRYYYQHRKNFSATETAEIEEVFARMLTTVERRRLPKSLTWRIWYYPFRSYWCFSLVEKLFFWFRFMRL